MGLHSRRYRAVTSKALRDQPLEVLRRIEEESHARGATVKALADLSLGDGPGTMTQVAKEALDRQVAIDSELPRALSRRLASLCIDGDVLTDNHVTFVVGVRSGSEWELTWSSLVVRRTRHEKKPKNFESKIRFCHFEGGKQQRGDWDRRESGYSSHSRAPSWGYAPIEVTGEGISVDEATNGQRLGLLDSYPRLVQQAMALFVEQSDPGIRDLAGDLELTLAASDADRESIQRRYVPRPLITAIPGDDAELLTRYTEQTGIGIDAGTWVSLLNLSQRRKEVLEILKGAESRLDTVVGAYHRNHQSTRVGLVHYVVKDEVARVRADNTPRTLASSVSTQRLRVRAKHRYDQIFADFKGSPTDSVPKLDQRLDFKRQLRKISDGHKILAKLGIKGMIRSLDNRPFPVTPGEVPGLADGGF